MVFAILTVCFSCATLLGQTFTGTQLGRSNRLNCLLQINPDKTVNFIYDQDQNGVYGEYLGSWTHLGDSVFQIEAVLTIGQFYTMDSGYGVINIPLLTPEVAQLLNPLIVTYANGAFRRVSGLDRQGRPKICLKIPKNDLLFRDAIGADYYTLSIPHRHPVTGKSLAFTIHYGSAASFTSGEKIGFKVRIKNGFLETFGTPPIQTGAFKLRKKT